MPGSLTRRAGIASWHSGRRNRFIASGYLTRRAGMETMVSVRRWPSSGLSYSAGLALLRGGARFPRRYGSDERPPPSSSCLHWLRAIGCTASR